MRKFVKYVVYSHHAGLRWYFKSTEEHIYFFISLDIKDVIYLFNGIYLLILPFKVNHIKGIW